MKIEDYSKYYIQGSDHYLIPKDVFKELFGEMLNWKDESKKQKEVINKINNYINAHWVIDNPIKFKNELLDILKEGKNE